MNFQTSRLFSKKAKSLFPLRGTSGLKFPRSKQSHQSQSTGPGLQESGSRIFQRQAGTQGQAVDLVEGNCSKQMHGGKV